MVKKHNNADDIVDDIKENSATMAQLLYLINKI